jgi:Ca-activated chloride channel family protein
LLVAEEFLLDWKVDQPAVLVGQSAELYGLVTIRPNPARLGAVLEPDSRTALPAHLIVVADVSGSMQTLIRPDPEARIVGSSSSEGRPVQLVETKVPSRLEVAQSVVRRLIGRLNPGDRLTLVAFDHQAYPLTVGTLASQREELEQAAGRLAHTGGGGTQMGQGLRAVMQSLGRAADPGSTRRVVLLTDGEDQEPAQALEQARLLGGEYHVPIHAFGTGECRVDFLKEIGQKTAGGGFDHITDEHAAEHVFDDFFRAQKNILATRVSLALWLAPEIHVQDLYRYSPAVLYMGTMKPDASNTLTIPIEYVEKGLKYEFLFQCKVPSRPAGRFRLARATLTYDVPALGVVGQKTEANIVVEYTDDRGRADVRVGDVRKIIARAEVQRQVLFLQEKIDAINRGTASEKDRTVVARLLDVLIKKYEEFGQQDEVNRYRDMREDYQRKGTISQEMLNRSLAASSKVQGGSVVVEDIDF